MTEHHYQIRLEQDLADIKGRVSAIGVLVSSALKNSVQAMEKRDTRLAYETILEDNPINRDVEACDRACHHFVARHLPAAGHLRLISSVLRANVVLERVGDYAATISREVTRLKDPIPESIASQLRLIANTAIQMFEQSVKAFVEESTDLARGTMLLEDRVDESFNVAFGHLVTQGGESSSDVNDLLGTLVILSMLERVSDQAKNICEYAVFAAEGETKRRKAVPVLFLDRSNDLLGPMARAIARKAYPDHGVYTTVGTEPASATNEAARALLERLGHETADLTPGGLENIGSWDDYKVVVCLNPETAAAIEPTPFKTVVVTWWSLPDPSVGGGYLEELYRVLSGQIASLMTTLRGEEFS